MTDRFDVFDLATGEMAPEQAAQLREQAARDSGLAADLSAAQRLVTRLESLDADAWQPDQPPALDMSRFADAQSPSKVARPRRRFSLALALPVAAATLAVVVGVIALQDDTADSPSPLTVTLEPLADTSGSVGLTVDGATARLVAAGLPTTDEHHHYEAWVGDETGQMISMGTFTVDPKGDASVSMPVTLDLSKYSAVDISLEEDDGNPAHSTISVFRGEL